MSVSDSLSLMNMKDSSLNTSSLCNTVAFVRLSVEERIIGTHEQQFDLLLLFFVLLIQRIHKLFIDKFSFQPFLTHRFGLTL